jgi:hypothetical protein
MRRGRRITTVRCESWLADPRSGGRNGPRSTGEHQATVITCLSRAAGSQSPPQTVARKTSGRVDASRATTGKGGRAARSLEWARPAWRRAEGTRQRVRVARWRDQPALRLPSSRGMTASCLEAVVRRA